MPSKPPSESEPALAPPDELTPTALDPVEEFVSLNAEAIAKLATFIDFAEGFTIGFVEINFLVDLEILIQQLKTHPNCEGTQFIELEFSDPHLRFLKDVLLEQLAAVPLKPDQKPILWIKGLEYSIGMSGEYPPMLVDLNFVRDAYTDQVPYPVLFCLPDYAINRMIKFAPDFWSWKSGLFRFQTRSSTQQQAADNTLFSDRIRGSLQLADWQERIDQLERLAMEYRPSSDPSREELANWCRVLMELGIAYRGQGEVAQAEYHLRRALEVAAGVETLQRQQGLLLHELGWICNNTGRVQEAETLYKKSIEIKETLGDDGNKAATLHQLGILKAKQGDIDAAIALYQQSLDITEKIGDAQGQAATLHELGNLKADQGETEAAIALYQQSLDIQEQIGNVQGQAATLHQLGNLKADQGEIEDAIALYQQSLDITEKIGNVQTQAATLHQLGILKANQGEIEDAIALYQQSLDIEEQIGNVQGQAATLHCLGILKANQGEIDEAIQLFEESVRIKRQIGHLPGLPPTLSSLAFIAERQGDIATAKTYLQEALAIAQRVGSPDAALYQSRLAQLSPPTELA
ncbi:tetratricopeptide repeat protein [Halomicronema sp. CCY15110]|uniref:tetratricopeptide repeat protein n=1 Tax=Halomicronema sp. CCY15110 TaxID=2767773 RepID=UPI001951F910|nr:tetratricopeptide repeat protein [Halomicronema sp. CCY15110]